MTPGSAADRAGIIANSIVVAVDDREIGSPDDLADVLSRARAGQVLHVLLFERGEQIEREVTLQSPAGTQSLPGTLPPPPLAAPAAPKTTPPVPKAAPPKPPAGPALSAEEVVEDSSQARRSARAAIGRARTASDRVAAFLGQALRGSEEASARVAAR